jgi:hypothetical protein
MKQNRANQKKVSAFVDRQYSSHFHLPRWLGACANVCVLRKLLMRLVWTWFVFRVLQMTLEAAINANLLITQQIREDI